MASLDKRHVPPILRTASSPATARRSTTSRETRNHSSTSLTVDSARDMRCLLQIERMPVRINTDQRRTGGPGPALEPERRTNPSLRHKKGFIGCASAVGGRTASIFRNKTSAWARIFRGAFYGAKEPTGIPGLPVGSEPHFGQAWTASSCGYSAATEWWGSPERRVDRDLPSSRVGGRSNGLQGAGPDRLISICDITPALGGFSALPYPFAPDPSSGCGSN